MNLDKKTQIEIAILATAFLLLGIAIERTAGVLDYSDGYQAGYGQAQIDYQIVNVPGEPPSPFMVLNPCGSNFTQELKNYTAGQNH